jgi:sirohydrochlorin ferrochelatase
MQVLILLAHGSRAQAAIEAHCDLAVAVADRTGQTVRPAFLEMAQPDLPSTIDAAADDGADHVTVLPHFLGPGNHVGRDIPALVDAARERHPDLPITLADHTGKRPEMLQTVVAAARSATSSDS